MRADDQAQSLGIQDTRYLTSIETISRELGMLPIVSLLLNRRYYMKYYNSQSYNPPAFLIFSQNQVLHIIEKFIFVSSTCGLDMSTALPLYVNQASI